MIHSSLYLPRVYPYNGDIDPAQIDRIQDLTGSITLNREKIKEVGRDGLVDWRKRNPTLRLTMRQLEYGSIEFWRKLTNQADDVVSIDLNDFKNAMVDVCGYKTDDSTSTFLGTIWYPELRVAGFSITVGDPEAYVERNFELIGEDEIALKGDNKYFLFRKFTASGGTDEEFTVSDGTTYPHATEDPDNSGRYILRVLQVSGTTTTELTYDATPDAGQYSYNNSTHVLTVGTTTAADVIKVYWSAATAGTQTFFTNNDSDSSALSADCCTILLSTATTVYKLQSVGINVAFDRTDYREIGNKDIVQRGIRNKTVSITLGRILESYAIEDVLRGEASSFGKIDVRNFLDDITLTVKIYNNNDKDTFKCKYKFTGLSPTSLDMGVPVDDYVTRGVTLEGEAMTIQSTDV